MKNYENIHKEESNKITSLSNQQIDELVKRKKDFLSGKTTSRSWNEIKKGFDKKNQIRN